MNDFANECLRLAARGAFDYLARNGSDLADDLADEIHPYLREAIKRAAPGALRDAKEAQACGMEQVAVTTFAASMVQAGIAAAKLYEAGAPA